MNGLRTKEVLKLTGWNRHYLDKLRQRGVIHAWQPYDGAWNWYDKTEILNVLNNIDNGSSKGKNSST